jgi:hypothetical protein
MAQNLADLSLAATTVDSRHQLAKLITACDPTGSATFVQATEVHELDIKAADTRRFAEHLCLQCAGCIPGRLPTHRGIERKYQPAAAASRRRRPKRAHLIDKILNFRL